MATPLKHSLSQETVFRLAENIRRAWPEFNVEGFAATAMQGLAALELKARVAHVAVALQGSLPVDYAQAVRIIARAGKTWDRGAKDDPMAGFAAWPMFDFIERCGLDDFRRSMDTLRAITHLFSAEFAVRPFIQRYPKRAFVELERWTIDSSEHVRRLASESCRPRLPWAGRLTELIEEPRPVLELLDRLKDDPSPYVRRSVANNLNDIAKDHPDRVLDCCERWLVDATSQRRWIVARATRSLVKQAHPRVWRLLGYTEKPRLEIASLRLSPRAISLGGEIRVKFEIVSRARSAQRVVLDYGIHFVKASGSVRRKVFKLKEVELAAGKTITIEKKHAIRAISTRAYYAGRHSFEVLINGKPYAKRHFQLNV